LNFKLLNHNNADENGKLTVTISPENFNGESFQFSKNVSVPKNAPALVDLNAENTKELTVSNRIYGGQMVTASPTSTG